MIMPAWKKSGCLKRNWARFVRDGSLLTSTAGMVGPTKGKGSPFVSHHLASGLGSARISCSATAKSWKKQRLKI